MFSKSLKQKILLGFILAIATGVVSLIVNFLERKSNPEHLDLKREYKFSGAIVDETNNSSINNAEISIVGRNEIYYSESNGNFMIPFKDSIAHVRIRITKKGYLPVDKTFDIPSPDMIIPLNKQNPNK